MSRGRGRGKASVFTPQLLGHLPYHEIISHSKAGHQLYPEDIVYPETTYPTKFEREAAARYQHMKQTLTLDSPYYLNAPTKPTIDPFEFARTADADEEGAAFDENHLAPASGRAASFVSSRILHKKYPLSEMQERRHFRISDQQTRTTPLASDNLDANLLPDFFLEMYPTEEMLKQKDQNKKKKKVQVDKLAAADIASDSNDGDSDVNSASDNDNGLDGENGMEDDMEADEEENDYGADHFDGGDGDGDDALGGGGDETAGID